MSVRAGFTLIELIVVVVIIAVLAAVALPVAQTSMQRADEVELRRALRQLRNAIDAYRDFAMEHKVEMDDDRYFLPKSLDELVEGLEYRDKEGNRRVERFLRRIPMDPMSHIREWGLRSFQDKRDSSQWGGENVWDVYCLSEKIALDGTPYRAW
ncbi:MAG: prepilin-type N-terminal cleavage/methylation domain-containing protein [Candidatus Aminicenantes bacterium]|nr:prepilin-type N-terminal cleavage/methylation domain-containing protein [Candidatus Aminicenantes bacterium]